MGNGAIRAELDLTWQVYPRAEKVGDEYLINGRKTWTSDAMDCDYIFVLARNERRQT